MCPTPALLLAEAKTKLALQRILADNGCTAAIRSSGATSRTEWGAPNGVLRAEYTEFFHTPTATPRNSTMAGSCPAWACPWPCVE
jgi:hypothetical protein